MCIVKIEVSAETRQAFEGQSQDEDQVFETDAAPETQAPTKDDEPKVKEVVIDFG